MNRPTHPAIHFALVFVIFAGIAGIAVSCGDHWSAEYIPTYINAPTLERAAFWDIDDSGSPSENDFIILSFNKEIEMPSASVFNYTLAVGGDYLGGNASTIQGPDTTQLTVILGSSPVFTLIGKFESDVITPGSPSGIAISPSAGAGIVDMKGKAAEPLQFVDIK